MTLKQIDKAIAMYEAWLKEAVKDAGGRDTRPGAGLISQIHNDLLVLYVMRKDERLKSEREEQEKEKADV